MAALQNALDQRSAECEKLRQELVSKEQESEVEVELLKKEEKHRDVLAHAEIKHRDHS